MCFSQSPPQLTRLKNSIAASPLYPNGGFRPITSSPSQSAMIDPSMLRGLHVWCDDMEARERGTEREGEGGRRIERRAWEKGVEEDTSEEDGRGG